MDRASARKEFAAVLGVCHVQEARTFSNLGNNGRNLGHAVGFGSSSSGVGVGVEEPVHPMHITFKYA